MRILFVGNSYTSRNDLPGLLRTLAAQCDPPITIETQAIVAGGASLRRHWNAGTVLQALNVMHWDYVVLQDQSTLPVKNAGRYHDNIRLYVTPIRERNAKLVLYLNWPRMGVPQTANALDLAVRQIGVEVGAIVVPVGPAWRVAAQMLPTLALYERDGSHPTVAGSYLAACVFFSVLSHQRTTSFAVSDSLGLERSVAAALHGIAEAAVGAG
jgi:hypothetical protein